MRYWARINKKSVGPFTPEQLRNNPEITEQTLVYPDPVPSTGAKWMKLGEVAELRPPSDPRPPSPPAPDEEAEDVAKPDRNRMKSDFGTPTSSATGFLKLLGAAVAVVFGFIFFLVITCSGPSSGPGDSSRPSPAQVRTPQRNSLEIAVGDVFRTSRFTDDTGSVRSPRSGNRWIIVSLTAKNVGGSKQRDFTRSWLKLVDSDGVIYERDGAGYSHPHAIDDANLNPGEMVRGVLVYQVPKNVSPTRLKYNDLLGQPFYVPLPKRTVARRSKRGKWAGKERRAVKRMKAYICPGGAMRGKTLVSGYDDVQAYMLKRARDVTKDLPPNWRPQSESAIDLARVMAVAYLRSGAGGERVEFGARHEGGPTYNVDVLMGVAWSVTGKPAEPIKLSFHVNLRTGKVTAADDMDSVVGSKTDLACFKK